MIQVHTKDHREHVKIQERVPHLIHAQSVHLIELIVKSSSVIYISAHLCGLELIVRYLYAVPHVKTEAIVLFPTHVHVIQIYGVVQPVQYVCYDIL